MKLSVIIPCYNGADTIATQLEALANQHWSKPWEVILSNNGSTDETVTIVEQYQKKLPNLRIVDASERQGQPYALNVGVQAATGEALALCDADDEVAPGWIAAMGGALAKYDFVAGSLETEKLNTTWVQKARRGLQQDSLQPYNYPPYLPHAIGCNLGFKRSLYDTIGEFDESFPLLHDTDYCWRAQLSGVEIHFVKDAVVHYRFRNTLSGVYRQAQGYAEFNVLLYKKYRLQGMPELPRKIGANDLVRLFRQLLRIRSKEKLARWVWKFGWQMGRLQGSIKHKVWAL